MSIDRTGLNIGLQELASGAEIRACFDRVMHRRMLADGRQMNMLLASTAFSVLALMAHAPAGAHSQLDRSVPAAASTVHRSPAQVTLWFSARLEPAFSRARVLDRNGKQVDMNDSRVDPNDAGVLRVSLPALAPGAYRVNWRVLSVDTHVVEGSFTFSVAP